MRRTSTHTDSHSCIIVGAGRIKFTVEPSRYEVTHAFVVHPGILHCRLPSKNDVGHVSPAGGERDHLPPPQPLARLLPRSRQGRPATKALAGFIQVVNGLSCIGCHKDGVRDFVDVVLPSKNLFARYIDYHAIGHSAYQAAVGQMTIVGPSSEDRVATRYDLDAEETTCARLSGHRTDHGLHGQSKLGTNDRRAHRARRRGPSGDARSSRTVRGTPTSIESRML